MIYYIAAPGLATSDSTQALQAAAFPTIPYPGVGQYHLSHNGKHLKPIKPIFRNYRRFWPRLKT